MADKELTSWTVFGERGSGTRWVSSILEKHTNMVNLSDTYVSGWKHGLWSDWAEDNLNDTNLVVCVHKDIFAWLLSFYRNPWHCQHLAKGSFEEFYKKEYFSVINNTKHQKWTGKSAEEEFIERGDGKRWPNVIQMWRDKLLSYQTIQEGRRVLHVDYLALLRTPSLLTDGAYDLGAKLLDLAPPEPSKSYTSYQYYTDHLFMEMFSPEEREFVLSEVHKESTLYPEFQMKVTVEPVTLASAIL